MSETRPLYWSVRRELWENRSVYAGPLAVAIVVVFGFAASRIGIAARRRAALMLDAAGQRATIGQAYSAAATILIVTSFLIAASYCLEALNGERRDRSILFWKSLPVSDRTIVLSKATIPVAVLPLIVFIVTVMTELVMALWSTVVLMPSGLASTTWTRFNLIEHWVLLLYGLVAVTLWHAPIYAWLLLVSAWARRAAVLWATLPLIAVGVFERVALNTTYFVSFLKHRFMGHLGRAFAGGAKGAVHSLSPITPGNFLTMPGLWFGLAFAAICLVTAARLRRLRGPI
jgi:ABC-2 type transport system permease protein